MNVTVDFSADAADLLGDYAADPTPSARVLIVTVFGDAIVPHAEGTWLGSLSQLLEPLSITDRLVRTSVRRLVEERLLVNRQEGRRSFYSVHPEARSTFWRAEQRIYRSHTPAWDGQWTLAILDSETEADTRQTIRQSLEGLGLGQLTPTTFASPTLLPADVISVLQPDHRGSVALTRSTIDGTEGTLTSEGLLARTAPLERLAADYEGFVDRYRALADSAATSPAIDPALAFAVRSLMVSDYRRIVLADPGVPAELVPTSWPERRAADVAGRLYRLLVAPSDERLSTVGVTIDGPLVLRDGAYDTRFTR